MPSSNEFLFGCGEAFNYFDWVYFQKVLPLTSIIPPVPSLLLDTPAGTGELLQAEGRTVQPSAEPLTIYVWETPLRGR